MKTGIPNCTSTVRDLKNANTRARSCRRRVANSATLGTVWHRGIPLCPASLGRLSFLPECSASGCSLSSHTIFPSFFLHSLTSPFTLSLYSLLNFCLLSLSFYAFLMQLNLIQVKNALLEWPKQFALPKQSDRKMCEKMSVAPTWLYKLHSIIQNNHDTMTNNKGQEKKKYIFKTNKQIHICTYINTPSSRHRYFRSSLFSNSPPSLNWTESLIKVKGVPYFQGEQSSFWNSSVHF